MKEQEKTGTKSQEAATKPVPPKDPRKLFNSMANLGEKIFRLTSQPTK
jgi:hypothetical protein